MQLVRNYKIVLDLFKVYGGNEGHDELPICVGASNSNTSSVVQTRVCMCKSLTSHPMVGHNLRDKPNQVVKKR